MSEADRADLKCELEWGCENHGPWEVLGEVLKVLRPEFLNLAGTEPKKSARVVKALDDAADAERAE